MEFQAERSQVPQMKVRFYRSLFNVWRSAPNRDIILGVNEMFTVCIGLVLVSKYEAISYHLLTPMRHKHQYTQIHCEMT